MWWMAPPTSALPWATNVNSKPGSSEPIPKTDIAVLKIDATDLPLITVADSSKVQVGAYALAIGDPFGVGQTVTMGIVSATGRSHLGIEDYEDFIHTDAPINPGNSGGALVNDRGDLIGINTAIIAHGSEGNQGIGFARPRGAPGKGRHHSRSERQARWEQQRSADGHLDDGSRLRRKPERPAQRIRTQLRGETGRASHDRSFVEHQGTSSSSALSGVSVQNLDAQSAKDLGLPANTQGVVVTRVGPSSPPPKPACGAVT